MRMLCMSSFLIVTCRVVLHYKQLLEEQHTNGYFFFFFQAEDGIRDLTVTGVQTCALPISRPSSRPRPSDDSARQALSAAATSASMPAFPVASTTKPSRSARTAHCTPSIVRKDRKSVV